jgi:hypothetical protein
MPQEHLQVSPVANDLLLKDHLGKLLKINPKEIQQLSVLKRSIDAVKNNKINLKVAVYFKGEPFQDENSNPEYPNVNAQEVIVGAGPAGLLPPAVN